ncbi:hypothetical protein DFJ74DRAFT_662610 [Hyaloraphidium curvatum]|nr:hypothetical protein DFJ74DRAFT_662610 [Hyaloraphidium curvatum]
MLYCPPWGTQGQSFAIQVAGPPNVSERLEFTSRRAWWGRDDMEETPKSRQVLITFTCVVWERKKSSAGLIHSGPGLTAAHLNGRPASRQCRAARCSRVLTYHTLFNKVISMDDGFLPSSTGKRAPPELHAWHAQVWDLADPPHEYVKLSRAVRH